MSKLNLTIPEITGADRRSPPPPPPAAFAAAAEVRKAIFLTRQGAQMARFATTKSPFWANTIFEDGQRVIFSV